MTPAEFVRARLDEVEARALAASAGHPCEVARGGHWQLVGTRHLTYDNGRGEDVRVVDVTGGPCMWYEQIKVRNDIRGEVAAHIAANDPAFVLAWVKAMRRVLLESQMLGVDSTYAGTERETGYHLAMNATVKLLASIWSGHPDFEAAVR